MNRRTFLKHLGIGAGAATAAIALPKNFDQWEQVSGIWIDPESDAVIGDSIEAVAWIGEGMPGLPVTPNGGDITIWAPWYPHPATFHSVTGNTLHEIGINNRGVPVAMR